MKLLIALMSAVVIASVYGEQNYYDDVSVEKKTPDQILQHKIKYIYGGRALEAFHENSALLHGVKKSEALVRTYNALKAATEAKTSALFEKPHELLKTLATDLNAGITIVHQLKTIAIELYYDLLRLLDEHDVKDIPEYFYNRLMQKLTELFNKTRNLRKMVDENQLGDMARSAGLGDVITKEKVHETLEKMDSFSLETVKPILDMFIPTIAHDLAPLFQRDLMKAVLDGFGKLCDSLTDQALIARFFTEVRKNEDLQSLKQTLRATDLSNPNMGTILGELLTIKDGVYKSAKSISELPIVNELRSVFENSMREAMDIMQDVMGDIIDDITTNSPIQHLLNMFVKELFEGFTDGVESPEEDQPSDDAVGFKYPTNPYHRNPYHRNPYHHEFNPYIMSPQQYYQPNYNEYSRRWQQYP